MASEFTDMSLGAYLMSSSPIERYIRLLEEIVAMPRDSLSKVGLKDHEDQERILRDMLKDGIDFDRIHSAASLFYHVDNIRFAYHEFGRDVDVPDWYRAKYGHLLKPEID